MKFKRGLIACAVITTAVAVIATATAPSPLEHRADLPAISDSPSLWLDRKVTAEERISAVTPHAEKRIRWHRNERDRKTPIAVIYIHGFSATRQEIHPVPELIADRLEANLFETRLGGHGLIAAPMAGVRAEDWMQDAAELLGVGRNIGDRLVIIGTSTGATLALSLLDYPESQDIDAFVLLSPNFGPADPNSEFLTWPGGLQLARLLVGDEHRWDPANELQARYWATAYPVDALVEMMRLVKHVRGQLPLSTRSSVLMVYSPHDSVIDTDKIVTSFELIESPNKRLVALPDLADPSNPGMHVLAGDIMAPQNNHKMADLVVEFLSDAEQ